jgi:Na+-transporting methylmalonyl-CoA/oxaloacetate decarboxylase gamma subunit
MKKYLNTLIVLILLISSYTSVIAQTPTATSSAAPTEEENQEQIERIKDIVASRVAELKLVEKKGILGTVEANSSTQITITDGKKNKRIIDIDEITEFNDPGDKNFGISDLKKGDMLGVIGLLNKSTEHILARLINKTDTIPIRIEGIIKDIDRKNFVVTVVDENGKEQKLDIQTSTKINSFNEEKDFIKSGFSKIEAKQRIFASGFPGTKDKKLLNTSRLIHFTSLLPSKNMRRNLEKVSLTEVPEPTK